MVEGLGRWTRNNNRPVTRPKDKDTSERGAYRGREDGRFPAAPAWASAGLLRRFSDLKFYIEFTVITFKLQAQK